MPVPPLNLGHAPMQSGVCSSFRRPGLSHGKGPVTARYAVLSIHGDKGLDLLQGFLADPLYVRQILQPLK